MQKLCLLLLIAIKCAANTAYAEGTPAAFSRLHKASGLPMDCRSLTSDDIPTLIPILEKIQIRMDDWPELNHYSKANAALLPPSTSETRVVFLGDSIFQYWAEPKFGDFFLQKSRIGRGISAQTTPQILLRLQSDVVELQPKVMVLLAGTNDIGSNTGPISQKQTEANIRTIAEICTGNGIKVILASLLPTSNYHFDGNDIRGPQTSRRPLEKICALNSWIKKYCETNQHIFLDYYSAMCDAKGMLKEELSDDDLHPNVAGYAVMAPLTEAAIAQALL